MWIIIFILFIVQIIGFYILALLNAKLSKFEDLENKQLKLMAEMDDSIAAYLAEVKDENERLIQLLNEQPKRIIEYDKTAEPLPAESIQEMQEAPFMKPPVTPRTIAIKSYTNTASAISAESEEDGEAPELNERAEIIRMSESGKTAEEIAKQLNKGVTEIQLILKFK